MTKQEMLQKISELSAEQKNFLKAEIKKHASKTNKQISAVQEKNQKNLKTNKL